MNKKPFLFKDTITIAERVAYLRSKNGYSVNEVSQQTGLSHSNLGEIENEKNTNPGIKTILTLCAFYGIAASEFFRGL